MLAIIESLNQAHTNETYKNQCNVYTFKSMHSWKCELQIKLFSYMLHLTFLKIVILSK
jgi:hypothetical protein